MSDYIPLKYYFGRELALRLANLIQPHYPRFSNKSFTISVA
ncbi:hypothetical protein DFR56_101343 [Pseudogracilibacillus auburnensis]|uniref:Uncharacterized protein n=1 Tax=Pseudogracilibacillus auburnensis TaxID=1494959 RepID=A0A2V3WBN8_9BACI|nr:hypothetical protein DFR56_101343 [Pseudogracilibacillus auburnensis]